MASVSHGRAEEANYSLPFPSTDGLFKFKAEGECADLFLCVELKSKKNSRHTEKLFGNNKDFLRNMFPRFS
jgi:hypothetical protein